MVSYTNHSADFKPINQQQYYIPCLFQDRHNTSSAGWDFAPGNIGVSVLFRSHMRISDSEAPLANRFACNKYIPRIYAHEMKRFLLSNAYTHKSVARCNMLLRVTTWHSLSSWRLCVKRTAELLTFQKKNLQKNYLLTHRSEASFVMWSATLFKQPAAQCLQDILNFAHRLR